MNDTRHASTTHLEASPWGDSFQLRSHCREAQSLVSDQLPNCQSFFEALYRTAGIARQGVLQKQHSKRFSATKVNAAGGKCYRCWKFLCNTFLTHQYAFTVWWFHVCLNYIGTHWYNQMPGNIKFFRSCLGLGISLSQHVSFGKWRH